VANHIHFAEFRELGARAYQALRERGGLHIRTGE
jgi:hypothetical protein